MDQRVICEQVGLIIKSVHTLVQRLLIGHCKLLSSLDLSLDFVLELCHVEHQLVDFRGPHGKLLSLEVSSVESFFTVDSLFAPGMSNYSPPFEESRQRVSIDSVPRVGSDSLLFTAPLGVRLEDLHTNLVHVETVLDLQEPLKAAHVLILELVQVEDLLLLIVNSLDELINVCLFFVKVHLVVILVFLHVAFFHTFVFSEEFLVEFSEKLVVS